MKDKVLALVTVIGSATALLAGCGNLGNVNATLAVRYTPDGTLVVFAGNTIDLYDEELATRTASIPTSPGIFTLSDDGNVAAVASASGSESRIAIFNMPARREVSSVDLGPSPADFAEDLALSPDGDLVYVMGPVGSVGTMNLMNGDGDSGGVAMFDTGSGAQLWAGDWASAPAFSSDGSQIFVSGKQGQDLQGFDARSGAPLLDSPVASPPEVMGSTADPHTLVGLFDGPIELLSTDDGSVLSQFAAVSDTEGLYGTEVLGLPAFRCSPQAGLCAVGVAEIVGVMAGPAPGDPPSTPLFGDPRVKVWSLTGTLYQTLAASASDVAISPDGQFLAIADQGDAKVFRIRRWVAGKQPSLRRIGLLERSVAVPAGVGRTPSSVPDAPLNALYLRAARASTSPAP